MSVAANLPSYADPFQGEALNRAPSYTAEPHRHEQRLAQADRVGPRPSGAFIKEKNNVRLRLTAQENGVELPVYGIGEHVTGVVELSKPAGITSVEVKVRTASESCATAQYSLFSSHAESYSRILFRLWDRFASVLLLD